MCPMGHSEIWEKMGQHRRLEVAIVGIRFQNMLMSFLSCAFDYPLAGRYTLDYPLAGRYTLDHPFAGRYTLDHPLAGRSRAFRYHLTPETVVEPNKSLSFYLELYLACVEQWDSLDEAESLISWLDQRGYCWQETPIETAGYRRSRIDCVRDHCQYPRGSGHRGGARKWRGRHLCM